MKKKRILHITYTMNQGGVDTLLMELLPLIKDDNITIDVLVLKKGNIAMKQRLINSGIGVVEGKYKNIYNPLNIVYLFHKMKGYDIVHTHLFPIQYFIPIACCFKAHSPVLITTEHCNTNKRRNIRWIRPIEKWIYSHYSKIIGVCRASSENLTNWIGSTKNIITIYNGVDFTRLDIAPHYDKSKLNLIESDITVMMVARFFKQKNQETAIQAFQYLPQNYKLIFVGDGPSLGRCISITKDLGLESRITFLGKRDDVPSLIDCCDIGLLSSHFEGLPISLLEFMNKAKPVIGTNIDGISDLIKNPDFLFEDNNPKQLSECVLKMIHNYDLMKTGNYNKRIASEFDINKTASQYRKVYYETHI